MRQLIAELKENDDDFEFYPSTKEMIQVISNDIKSSTNNYRNDKLNILDVGCGNGNGLYLIEECFNNSLDEYGNKLNSNLYIKKFGIEKSKILIQNMKEDIIIIGSDFEFNTLIDKQMDHIFCNPPYSQFTNWATKLINESNCKSLYLIIPQRWKENVDILNALKNRFKKFTTIEESDDIKILGSFDFLDSEYRKARAKVDVIKINFNKYYSKNPFDVWFDENFKIKEQIEVEPEEEVADNNDIVEGQNLIDRIVNLYNNDLNFHLNNCKKLQEIDANLLYELGVDKNIIKEGLKSKIKNLKNKYWNELFNNLDKITDRLTTKYRKIILEKITATTSIDVNIDNMYSVVIWIVKNSNIYQDEQLLDTYDRMTEPKNIEMYKSNKHFVADKWRYNFKNEVSKYKLDYRLVFPCGIHPGEWSYNDKNGISEGGYDFVSDLFTIAKTLGMKLNNCDLKTRQWIFGKQNIFNDDNGEIFAELRPYKNGNLHAKFNKEFILKLNIEAGKLKGWIKDPEHASDEMNIDKKTIEKYFDNHIKIGYNNDINFLIEYKE